MTRRSNMIYFESSEEFDSYRLTDDDLRGIEMAKILPDTEIRKLIGTVIKNGDPDCIRINSYEMRLGDEVRFMGTSEKKELSEGKVLEIAPSESVMICSYEEIDFSNETIRSVFDEDVQLVGFITPRTTMFREGIAQLTSRVDPGYKGTLNWPIRNDSGKPCRIPFGERIYKLTLFMLGEGEKPESIYGDDKDRDYYHERTGIVKGKRWVPTDLDRDDIVKSKFGEIEDKERLALAGSPFSEIGSELTELDGKIVSLSQEVKDITSVLGEKIEALEEKLGKWLEKEVSKFKEELERYRGYAAALFGALFVLLPLIMQGEQTAKLISYGLGALCFVICILLVIQSISKPRQKD